MTNLKGSRSIFALLENGIVLIGEVVKLKVFNTLLVMGLAMSACTMSENVINADSEYLQIIGRHTDETPDEVWFAYPGITLLAEIDADAVQVELTDSSLLDDNGKTQHNIFLVVIDGEAKQKIELQNGRHSYTVAENLDKGTHTIELVKLTEAMVGKTAFNNFHCTGLRNITKPKFPERTLEIIGNSITCGYGIESNNPEEHFDYRTENAYLAYALSATRMVGAKAQLVAYSGKGVHRNWADTVYNQETMIELYNRCLPLDPESEWDFARFTPKAVAINLGSNDFSPPLGADKEMFQERYSLLLNTIRDNYGPYIPIICINGPLLIGKDRETLKNWLNEIIVKQNDKDIHYLELSTVTEDDGWGADFHPAEKTASRNAEELAEAISEIMQWK